MDAQRDWGFAGDYVEGMWKILQASEPDTFVLATGITTPVRDFVKWAFKDAGFEISFQGTGINEVGIDTSTGKTLVKVSEKYFRPSEVDLLIGDPAKSKIQLDWMPKVGPRELCKMMVQSDLERVQKNKIYF